jgi:hypothetical protein
MEEFKAKTFSYEQLDKATDTVFEMIDNLMTEYDFDRVTASNIMVATVLGMAQQAVEVLGDDHRHDAQEVIDFARDFIGAE